MDLSLIIPHIEALIFASEKPLAPNELAELVNNALGFIEDRATEEQVKSGVEAIHEKYDSELQGCSEQLCEGRRLACKRKFHRYLFGWRFDFEQLRSNHSELLAV